MGPPEDAFGPDQSSLAVQDVGLLLAVHEMLGLILPAGPEVGFALIVTAGTEPPPTAHLLPSQAVPPVHVAFMVMPAPLGEVGTSDLALLYRKKILLEYGIVTLVLVPESAVPVLTGGVTMVPALG